VVIADQNVCGAAVDRLDPRLDPLADGRTGVHDGGMTREPETTGRFTT